MAKNRKSKKHTAKASVEGANTQHSASTASRSTGGRKSGALSSISRRNALRGAAAAVLAVGVGLAIHRHDVQARELHDLSSLGEGIPAVVQVHDPSCPLCRRLMGATKVVMEEFPGVAYRIADVTTDEGNAFQSEYGAPTVTLLLFDGAGQRVQTLTGVRTADELREIFAATFDSVPATGGDNATQS